MITFTRPCPDTANSTEVTLINAYNTAGSWHARVTGERPLVCCQDVNVTSDWRFGDECCSISEIPGTNEWIADFQEGVVTVDTIVYLGSNMDFTFTNDHIISVYNSDS